MACSCSVDAQHEDVISEDLEVIGRVVARVPTLVVEVRHLAVCLHGEVAAEAASHPRRVAGEATHVVVPVRDLLISFTPLKLPLVVQPHGLRVGGLPVVVAVAFRYGVLGLLDAPP